VNWQQQTANLMSLAGNVPASPVYMGQYLSEEKRKNRGESSTTVSSLASSPSSSMLAHSSTASPTTTEKTQKDMVGFNQGPELEFRL